MSVTEPDIVSPCISVCMLDPDTRLCIGCYRNAREIGEWRAASRERRLELIDLANERREAAEAAAANS